MKSLILAASAITGLMAVATASAWTTVDVADMVVDGSAPVIMPITAASFSDPAFGHQAWAHTGSWGAFNAEKGRTYRIAVDGRAIAGLHPAVTVWKRPVGTPTNPYSYWDGTLNQFVSLTNLAPAENVPDHFFFPVQSYIESGTAQQHVLESSGGQGCTTQWTRTIGTTSVTASPCDFWKSSLRSKEDLAANPGVLLEDGSTYIGFPRMLWTAAAYDADGATKLWNTLNNSPQLEARRDGQKGFVVLTFRADETSQYQFYVGGINPDLPIKGRSNVSVFVVRDYRR
jgi:Copper(I)-binding protein CorA